MVLLVLIGAGIVFRDSLVQKFFQPTAEETALNGLSVEWFSDRNIQKEVEDTGPDLQIVAENLSIPWEVVFLPDGSLLVTERPGRIVRVWPQEHTSLPVQGVAHVGEGGLLGLALHPDYEENHWVYVYLTTRVGAALTNRVERYEFNESNNTLDNRTVIVEGISGAANHDGGRIAFGPDGLLYITTGDAQNGASAQDRAALSGKILRLRDDGSVPAENPFGTAVYSYGHRNPQGLAWDKNGQLWATEHGRSGVQSGFDEVNRIEAGRNYGWPDIEGDETAEAMVSPVLHSGARETWAPAGAAVVGDTLFFTGLRGEALYSAKIQGQRLSDFTAHFKGQYGRLRAVVVSPDGEWLYITTSNRDGRGAVQTNDDKIIKIRVNAFFE